ncbi:MAG: DUF2284 domain-containing protein [Syntrophorhabdaceae bacterium]|nr:DUF2284 domain-containing protein [Syntrophorhabdaceae bacterium]
MQNSDLEKYIGFARERGIDDAVIVETSSIHTAPWVRMKCQFGCGAYGLRWSCPPHTPDHEKTRSMLDSYTQAILLHSHWVSGYSTVTDLNDTVVDLETTLFLDGFYKAFGFGCGFCTRCKKCDTTKGCVHPERMRPSMESCGIDVYQTARANGLPIEVVRNHAQDRDVYGIVLIE